MRSRLLFANLLLCVCISHGQTKANDTLLASQLPGVMVLSKLLHAENQPVPEVLGMMILAAKKSNYILPDKIQGNVSNNSMRQILVKVPGIHVWENDGSGIQIAIATRGLSPNRSWDFNIRQNGYDIAADPYGYPEAYYHPPMAGVQRIEIVRGHGALQYGPQLGGMVNYVLKDGEALSKPWQGEAQIGVGSNKLYYVHAGNGFQWKNGHGYAFFDHRQGNGWRDNNQFKTDAGFISLTNKLLPNLSLTSELAISTIKSQQPGGLTDSMYQVDARQSIRARNWMMLNWMTPALTIQFAKSDRFQWSTKMAATIGDRGSVGMLSDLLTKDTFNTYTQSYNPRLVQIDRYRNFMAESRVLFKIPSSTLKHTITAGLRFFRGNTYRQSNGKGTNGFDTDLSISEPFPADLNFSYTNYAAFAEAIIKIHSRLFMIPGVRYEWLQGSASGRNNFNADGKENLLSAQARSRSFLLPGLGLSYKLSSSVTLYANATAAYRPMQFSNLQVVSTTDSLDIDLKDSKGYNADLGCKGYWGEKLRWDISLFFLSYQNRIGTITPAGSTKRLITNLGASLSRGLESFIEWYAIKSNVKNIPVDLTCFASYSYTDARYEDDYLVGSVKGNRVENAPAHILRTGMSFGNSSCLLSVQYNYVHGCFSDANNTRHPTPNGQTGFIPAYRIWDVTLQSYLGKKIQLKTGFNNVFNERYFTRRAGGYPGPGILPGDGRCWFLTLLIKS